MHRGMESGGVEDRVENQCIQLSAQPGELALGQLAGREDGAVAEFVHRGRAIQVLPRLSITDRAQRRQFERCGMRLELRNRAQRTHLIEEPVFEHRIDTLQLGIAPYEHDFDTLATWFVVQGRQYTGGIHEGTEWALLLRLFKGGAWIEAGATEDGKLQAMAMFNF